MPVILSVGFWKSSRSTTHHLDFEQSLVAVIHKISRLPTVNSDNTQQQLSAKAQRHRRLALVYYSIDACFDVLLQNMCFVQLALKIGRQPDTGQRPCLRQQGL
jgi:hypothetical protein